MNSVKRISAVLLLLSFVLLTGCQQIKDIFNPTDATNQPSTQDTASPTENPAQTTQPSTQPDTQASTNSPEDVIKEGSSLAYNEDSGDPASGSAVNISIALPQFIGEGSQSMNSYMSERFDIIKTAALALKDSSDPLMGGGMEYQYDYRIVTGSKYINVIQDEYAYMAGGVHPTSNRYADNFDAKTGQRILLADFFNDNKGYINDLAKRTYEIMYADTKKYEYVGGYSRADIDAKPLLKDEIIGFCIAAISDRTFLAGEEGLTLIYNPYAIAPYAMGIIEIIIPWRDIK